MKNIFFAILLTGMWLLGYNQDKSDWMGGVPEGCTSITVGKKASFDGSVITSHTDDSHRTRSWMNIVPAKDHKPGDVTLCIKEWQQIRWLCRHMPITQSGKFLRYPILISS